MNRIVLALAALAALLVMPNASYATGCRVHHHHHHCGVRAVRAVAVAPVARVSLHDRLAKFRAERAKTAANFRASLALLATRAPRPAVAAAPRRDCGLFSRARAVVAAPVVAAPRRASCLTRAAAPVRVAGCVHRRCR